jgi:hypothetical protein
MCSQVSTHHYDGAYAPITSAGTLMLADGHVASCYAEFESHSIQHTIFKVGVFFE